MMAGHCVVGYFLPCHSRSPASRAEVRVPQLGWTLTAHPDGTSQIRGPAGQTIHSHSPPPRPG